MIISIYFKLVFTSITKYYEIDTNKSPYEMYIMLKPLIQNDFNINSFELVEISSRINDTRNCKSEERPAFMLTDDISLDDIFGDKINSVAFYIREI